MRWKSRAMLECESYTVHVQLAAVRTPLYAVPSTLLRRPVANWGTDSVLTKVRSVYMSKAREVVRGLGSARLPRRKPALRQPITET